MAFKRRCVELAIRRDYLRARLGKLVPKFTPLLNAPSLTNGAEKQICKGPGCPPGIAGVIPSPVGFLIGTLTSPLQKCANLFHNCCWAGLELNQGMRVMSPPGCHYLTHPRQATAPGPEIRNKWPKSIPAKLLENWPIPDFATKCREKWSGWPGAPKVAISVSPYRAISVTVFARPGKAPGNLRWPGVPQAILATAVPQRSPLLAFFFGFEGYLHTP